MTPFDQNLERLLREAYQPETPDPLFVANVRERLQATARERAKIDILEHRTVRLRKLLGSIAALAAVVAFAALIWRARQPWPTAKSDRPMIPVEIVEKAKFGDKPEFLTPKPKGESPKLETLAVGKKLETGSDRKRVGLPDGSVVFVNRGSSLRLESERRVVLERGEIYVEVAPKDGDRFVVKTPDRSVIALGTHFDVRADENKTSVVVTQGKVQVSGLDSLIFAGQQLLPDAERPAQAPRASALLNWTRDLMGEGLVAANQYGGGKLLAYDSAGQEAKISLRSFHLDVHIEDGFARTTIDQTYFNHESGQLEGTFYFPLPADASISRLAMYVNGMLMEGGMAEREQARNTFEQIRYTRRDPALLEWLDGSTFKMRVFPLEGRQEKRIILSYTQRLPVLHGKASYRFPMGHNLQVVDNWSATIDVAGGANQSWASPSHSLQEATRDGRLILTDSAQGVKLDKDLQLELAETNSTPTRIAQAQLDGQRYLMLRHRPELSTQYSVPGTQGSGIRGQDSAVSGRHSTLSTQYSVLGTPSPRHFVFLFETSADRDPLLARAQIEVLRTILENLEHADTFQVVTAGTRTRLLNESAVEATQKNIDASIQKLEHTQLIGAFDLENALAAVDPFLRDQKDAWLIHLGSGIPALGERRTEVLAGRIPEGVHYAGIAIGKRWSRAFMKAAAGRTGGNYTQINPDEPVAWRAFDFLATLRLPRWQNLTATDDSGHSWLLSESSLCAGEELCAVGRLGVDEPLPKRVILRGTIDGKPFERTFALSPASGAAQTKPLPPASGAAQTKPLSPASGERGRGEGVFTPDAGYIPRFWGRLEIDCLVADNAESNKQKIVDLSKSLYVMSPYTSLLVLENEQMYQQFKIDRGRKDHWAMYDCPARIDVRTEPSSEAKPVAANNEPKRAATVADVLKSIMVRNVAPPGTPQTDFTKPMTVWDLIGAPAHLADVPALPRYKVEFKNTPWPQVFERLRDLTGMPVNTVYKPAGALTFVPKPPSKMYTLPEIIDIINDALQKQQLLVYRREASFSLIAVDESSTINFIDLPRVKVEDLPRLGRTERVSVAIQLHALNAEELAPEVRKLLSNFGQVTPLSISNQLVILDKAGNLRRIVDAIELADGGSTAFARGLNSRLGLSGMMEEGAEKLIPPNDALSLPFYPPALGLVVYSPTRYRPSVKYPRAMRDNILTRGLDIPLRSASFGMAIPPFQALGHAPYYPGYGGNLGAFLGFGGGGFGGGLGGFGGGLGGGGLGGGGLGGGGLAGFGGANGFGMGGQLGMGAGQLGALGSWQMQPYGGGGFNFNGWTQFGGFGGQFGNFGQVGQFGGYGQFGFAGSPHYGTPLADRAKTQQIQSEAAGKKVQLADAINGRTRDLESTAELGIFAEVLGQPLAGMHAAASGPPLTYRAPTINGVNFQLFFRDLVAFAPGMETSWADIQAAIEAEVKTNALEPGLVDEAARKLIHAARAGGWRKHSIKLSDSGSLDVTFDYAGRFAFDRVLPTGLREMVICDGATLLHLYPELGLGAKRTMSRFHRAKFAGMILGALPPVEDLALGADLKAIDAHTVAIVPHSEIQAKVQLRLIFGDDGRFIEKQLFDTAAKKVVSSEKFAKLPAAKAPSLKPDTSKLVLLPLPYRTLAWAEKKAGLPARPIAKLSADETDMLIAAHFAAATSDLNPPYAFSKYVSDRFGEKPHPFGLDVLLRTCGDVTANFGEVGSPDSNESLMRVYFSQVERQTIHARQFVSRPGLFREMATLHNIWFEWNQSGNRTSGGAIEESWKRTREFIERNRRNPLGWMAMLMAAPYHNLGASSYQAVAEAWQLFESDPQHGYTARYERMRSLLNGSLPQTARLVFDDLYRQTLAAGVIPPLDGDVTRLPPNEEGVTWSMTLVRAAGDLAKKNRGFEALAIAEQCRQMSQLPLAQQVLVAIEPNLKNAGPSLRLAAALTLARVGDKAKADELLNPLLRDRDFSRAPMVWRLAADLAAQRQSSARVAKYLEKALDLEWEHLPELVDLTSLRADYSTLLGTYAQLLAAHRETDTKPPADLAARAIKFGDRWRCVDPDPAIACQVIARLLRDLGETDRAWDYLTSPIALSPGEAAPYQKLAEELKVNGDNALAEKAYAAAFAAEPTNAQYLMDRATLLQQLGKSAEARKLLQQLADGTWQPRFDAVKNQARWMLRQ